MQHANRDKTIAFLALMLSGILTCCSTDALAVDYTLKLVANQSAIESEFEALMPSFNSIVTAGVSGVYQSDDYKIAYAKALFGNEIFVRGLTGGLGLKAALGEIDFKHDTNWQKIDSTGYVGLKLFF